MLFTKRDIGDRRGQPTAFTIIELLVIIAITATLAGLLLPTVYKAREQSQASQCMANFRELMSGWRMYAVDNNDILAPNDYPYTTAFWGYANSNELKNWVVGTMEQVRDAQSASPSGAAGPGELELTVSNTVLSHYISNPFVYHCPADYYVDPLSHTVHPRSVSMNSAVGTIYWSSFNGGPPLGSPVQGGWLGGADYYPTQTNWLTYGKMSSFISPGPANTFVLMDENAYSINDASFNAVAFSTPTGGYIIDYPGARHDAGATMAFVDGHVLVHTWLNTNTYILPPLPQPGDGSQGPTYFSPEPDCVYLASVTSAAR